MLLLILSHKIYYQNPITRLKTSQKNIKTEYQRKPSASTHGAPPKPKKYVAVLHVQLNYFQGTRSLETLQVEHDSSQPPPDRKSVV